MHRKEGQFEQYKDKDSRIVAIFDCGGCPPTSPGLRMKQLKDWITPMNESVDVVHLATCVKNHCAYKDEIIEIVKGKAGVPVVVGTHPYVPKDIFAK